MKHINKIIILLFSVLLFTQTAKAQNIDLQKPLPIDTKYKIGKLENGMTYYIRHAENPAGRAEFFIVHNVGSLQ